MRLLLTACTLALLCGVGHASNWRDGCPSGRDGEYTRLGRFGAFASTDSIIQTHRFTGSVNWRYLSSDVAADGSSHRYGAARIDGVLLIAQRSLLSLALEAAHDLNASDRSSANFGRMTLGFGQRYAYRAALYPEVDASDNDLVDKYKNSQGLAGVRKAVAWQVTASVRRMRGGRGSIALGLLPSLQGDAGEISSIGFIDSIGARFEYRTEIVGCYAPFLHLELAPRWLNSSPDSSAEELSHAVYIPAALSAGIQVRERVSVYAQYRLEMLGGDVRGSNELSFRTSHRFRIGVQVDLCVRWRLGVALDASPDDDIGIGIASMVTYQFDDEYKKSNRRRL
jgi:hypothetical protein